MKQLYVSIMLTVVLFHSSAHADFFKFFSRQKPQNSIQKIWVFNSEFTGEYATRLAAAEAFPNATIETLSLPDGDGPIDVKSFMRAQENNFPDLIIHSMSSPRENDFLLGIKKLSRNETFVLCLDDPKSRQAEFDLIVSPQHLPPVIGKNVLRTMGLPSRVTAERLEKAKEEWHDTFAHLPHPIIAVFIGGQTQQMVFSRINARDLGTYARGVVKDHRGSLIATNSRRTSAIATSFFLSSITSVPFYFHDVRNQEDANPYFAMLAYADYIVTTGDSLSMVSDAVTTGKPVYVFAPPTTVEDRHKNLISNLFQAGKIRAPTQKLESWQYLPLNTAQQIAKEVQRRRGICEVYLTLQAN